MLKIDRTATKRNVEKFYMGMRTRTNITSCTGDRSSEFSTNQYVIAQFPLAILSNR